MKNYLFTNKLQTLFNLLRWNKPTGRLILLIPAGWSLWLTPSSPPSVNLVSLIMLGGILVSASGCIANDLWDRRIDSQVHRTKDRPLAKGSIRVSTAVIILIFLLLLSLRIIFLLPLASQNICLKLAVIALFPIFLYPSSKRWFHYPQALLSICWGFSVLIPWAASESSLNGGVPLLTCWLASMMWTFGFDTVYAMADKADDRKLGLNSSALALGKNAYRVVSTCYAFTSILIAIGAFNKGIGAIFWPIWLLASISMQKEVFSLKVLQSEISASSRHFRNQVLLGGLILSALILGNL